MTRCWITVDEGSDTASYHTNEAPTYEARAVPSHVEGEPDSRIVFCVFVPMNGHSKGKLMFVPFSRVISVSENKT